MMHARHVVTYACHKMRTCEAVRALGESACRALPAHCVICCVVVMLFIILLQAVSQSQQLSPEVRQQATTALNQLSDSVTQIQSQFTGLVDTMNQAQQLINTQVRGTHTHTHTHKQKVLGSGTCGHYEPGTAADQHTGEFLDSRTCKTCFVAYLHIGEAAKTRFCTQHAHKHTHTHTHRKSLRTARVSATWTGTCGASRAP